MVDPYSREAFLDWLHSAVAEAHGDSLRAFSINLYDSPFGADLIGSDTYDEHDEDWCCEEDFVPSNRRFDFPDGGDQIPWEERLAEIAEILKGYFSSDRARGTRFISAEAVCVGFVDGTLVRVWPIISEER